MKARNFCFLHLCILDILLVYKGEGTQNGPRIRFLMFFETFVMSFWCVDFLRKPHVWQNPYSQFLVQIAFSQLDSRIR